MHEYAWHSVGNQSVGSSVPVVSRRLWPGNSTFLEVASMVFTWLTLVFLCSTCCSFFSLEGFGTSVTNPPRSSSTAINWFLCFQALLSGICTTSLQVYMSLSRQGKLISPIITSRNLSQEVWRWLLSQFKPHLILCFNEYNMFEPRNVVEHFTWEARLKTSFPTDSSSARELSHCCLTQSSFRFLVK